MIRNCIGIDINEINRGIDFYRKNHNGDYPHYLIMNMESYVIMREIARRSIMFHEEPGYYPTWHGIPVARCENLKLGEVDFV